ncbi:MAG: transposase, partial [Promethearchaeota archaeon]
MLRKNASTKSRGSPFRAEEARYIKEHGLKKWKKTRQYKKRWAVERTFGSFKRIFGDSVRAKKWEHIVFELKVKMFLYHSMLLNPRFKEADLSKFVRKAVVAANG